MADTEKLKGLHPAYRAGNIQAVLDAMGPRVRHTDTAQWQDAMGVR